jgi:hypothetical protein
MGCWGIQTLPLATIAKVHSSKHLVAIIFGREICSNLEIAQSHEWLVTNGLVLQLEIANLAQKSWRGN